MYTCCICKCNSNACTYVHVYKYSSNAINITSSLLTLTLLKYSDKKDNIFITIIKYLLIRSLIFSYFNELFL